MNATTSRDKWPVIVLASVVFIFLVLRAALVPFIHDEARAFQLLVLPGDFLPIAGPWDVGNHVLQTALEYGNYRLFGSGMFSLRLWSLLAFILYAAYLWRMGPWFTTRVVRWCAWCALLCTPFVLDFFALARGYSIGLAFLVMALVHLVRTIEHDRTRDLILALVAMVCAVYALLSMLVLWCAFLGILALALLRGGERKERMKRLLWMLALGILPVVPAIVFGMGLSHRGMLYGGSDAGLYSGTFRSLSTTVLDTGHVAFVALVLALLTISVVLAIGICRNHWRRPLVVISAIMLLDLAGHTVMAETMNVLYPVNRGAIFLVPLALLLIALGIDHLARTHDALKYVAALLLFLPLRAVATADFHSTRLWPEQSTPSSFFDVIAGKQRASDRLLMVGAHLFLQDNWSYANMRRHDRLNELDVAEYPQPICDFLLMDTTTRQAPAGFRTIARAPGGRNNLMERIEPPHTMVALDSCFALSPSSDEFTPLWQPPVTAWGGRAAFVEVTAAITCAHRTTDLQLVVEMNDSTGQQLFWQGFEIDHHRGAVEEGSIRIARRLPMVPPTASRVMVHLYNPLRRSFGLGSIRVKVFEVLP